MRISRFILALCFFLLLGSVHGLRAAGRMWNVSFSYRAGSVNPVASEKALAEVDALFGGERRSLTAIRIRTASSPEGKYNWNLRLAQRRSDAVVSLLKQRIPELDENLIQITNVAEDWAAVERYVAGSDKEWKKEALELIRSEKPDKEERMIDLWGGVAWDDLLWNCFTTIRCTEVEFVFAPDIQFSATSQDSAIDAVPVELAFAVGSTGISASYSDNPAQLERLSSLVQQCIGSSASLVVDAYASPEGRVSWNLVLARRRAQAVKQRLLAAGIPEEHIVIRTQSENWNGLRAYVDQFYPGRDKEELLRILDDDSIDDAKRESMLRALSSGYSWAQLSRSVMPELRLVRVSRLNK